MPTFERLLEVLAVGAVLLLPARILLGGLRARPQRGVLVLAALVPFNGLLLIAPLPGLAAGWKEALTLLVAAAAVVAPPEARTAYRRPAPFWLPAVGGLLLLSVASAAVVGGLQSLVALKIGFFYLLLPAILWRCPLNARERDRLVTILMVDGFVTAVVGLLQQVVGDQALVALGYEYDTTVRFAGNTLRSFSTFNQPFGFGLFVMVVLLVATPVALHDPRRLRNQLYLASTPLLVAGMLTSIVRAAYLGLLVGGLWLAVYRYRPLLLALPPALVSLAFVPTSLLTTVFASSSLAERSSGWRATFAELLANPFGVGVGASGAAAEKAATLARSAARIYQPDNYYYKTTLELGVLGLWMLVLLLVAAAGVALRAARRTTGGDAALAAGVAASVVAAAVAATVSTYLEIFPLDVFFWLLLGVVTCLDKDSAPSTGSALQPAAVLSSR